MIRVEVRDCGALTLGYRIYYTPKQGMDRALGYIHVLRGLQVIFMC